jgi:type IV secretory pathway VirB10-like protein
MNAAPAQDLNPPAAASSGPALALSLLAHALLVLALAWGVNWSRTDPTVAFSAEIWAPVAERAAPAATAPEASPKPTPPPPQERPAPPPPPPPARVQQEARDADLALEKRRKEKQKAEEKAEKQAKEKAQKDKAEKEKIEKDRKEKEDKQREKAKEEARKEEDRKEAAESEKRRQEQLRRIQGQASSTTATGTPGADAAYALEGIGASVPPANLDRNAIDSAVRVSDADSFAMAKRLVREEGMLVGGSAGANVAAAVAVAQRGGLCGPVVTVLCDAWDRYRSKPWMQAWAD